MGDTEETTPAAPAEEIAPTPSEPVEETTPTPSEPAEEIAPTPSEPEAIAPEAEILPAAAVPTWPFYAYLGAWIVLASVAVWQLLELPEAVVAYESQAYGYTVLGGLIMTAVGPLLILAVWFTVRNHRAEGNRSGLLSSALLKGSLTTLIGAVIWWAALITVDYIRLGQPL